MSRTSSSDLEAPVRSRTGLGLAILILAALALAVEFWMFPALRFWEKPNDPMQQGVAAFRKGDYETAIAAFNVAIERNPRLVPAYNFRGNSYRMMNKFDLALADFNKAVQLAPAEAGGYYHRGLVYLARKEYQQAIEDFSATVKRNPTYAPAFSNRGVSYRYLGQIDKAFADFDESVRLAPKESTAYVVRGYSFSIKGEYAKAVADFNQAIAVEPDNSRGYNSLAWLQATCPRDEFRDGRRALEHANKACQLTDWSDYRSLDTLAAAYAETGDFEQARKWQEHCIAMKSLPAESVDDYKSRLALYQDKKPFRMIDKQP